MSASVFSRFLTVALASALTFGVGSISAPTVNEVLGASKSKHIAGGKVGYRTNRKFRSHRGYGSRGVSRAGIRRVGISSGSSKVRKFRRHNSVEIRRRQIEQRNRRVAIENHLQSVRRSGSVLANPHRSGALYYGNVRETIINEDPYTSAGTQVIYGGAARSVCPASHNCGYRVYENGTGPRIITPGLVRNGNLPAFDGLSGPVIITVD